MRKFLKTKYYPVDIHNRVIYDEPHNTERECSFGRGTTYTGRVGVTGRRLMECAKYEEFAVVANGPTHS